MPDLGEGTIEAEIVAWYVRPGDDVTEDSIVVEVMTDKAAVEVPAPVSGRVISIAGVAGDKIPVGSPLIVFEAAPTTAQSLITPTTNTSVQVQTVALSQAERPSATASTSGITESSPGTTRHRVMISPANRRRAREAGIDLSQIQRVRAQRPHSYRRSGGCPQA
jgi:2-oxoisovalerate dehydrogenase E2 component (dihydrolipoyl transacylase)